MTKKASKAEFNAFVSGFITEANPLNFPPNASFDEENFDLSRKGVRSRRLGMGFENGYTLRNTSLTTASSLNDYPEIYEWSNVNGDELLSFAVVQIGTVLTFFNKSMSDMSTSGYVGQITLSEFPVGSKVSLSSVNGYLIAACGDSKIGIITYDGTSFSAEYSPILVRDMWGVEVVGETQYETDILYRGGFDAFHYYNLQNQSWGIPRRGLDSVIIGFKIYSKFDPIGLYSRDIGKYPSNSEVVWTGLQFQPVSKDQEPFERIYTNLFEEQLGADIKAAKGYFIIDAMKRGTSRVTAYESNRSKYPEITYSAPSLPSDTTEGGPAVVTEYAGRIWYAGFSGKVIDGDARSPSLSNHVFFSQLVRNKGDYSKCYQEGDPTSRENNDVVDTDGGFIPLAGAERIIGMRDIGSHLIVIATNGVWAISGGSDYGFSATNIRADKISSFGGISESSIVDDGSKCLYWAEDGIYTVAKDQYGAVGVSSLTESRIESFYQEIPNESKKRCKGVFDKLSKKVRWLYKEGDLFSSSSKTIELIFDVSMNAFIKYRIYNSVNNKAEVIDMFESTRYSIEYPSESVLSNTDVVFSSDQPVIVSESVLKTGIQSVRYLCMYNEGGVIKYTFSYYKDVDFLDWKEDAGGVDAKAFIITGDSTAGDSSVAKQVPYVTMHFQATETGLDSEFTPIGQSSCKMRSQWNWSNSSLSNKWSSLQEVYRNTRVRYYDDFSFGNGSTVVTTRNKVRGRGRSFALYMETSPLKNCIILGWNLNVNGNGIT